MGLRGYLWSCVVLIKTVLTFVRLCENKWSRWRLCEVLWSCVRAHLRLFLPVLCLSVCYCVWMCECMCLCVSVCACVWVYVPVCERVWVFMSLHVSGCVNLCEPVCALWGCVRLFDYMLSCVMIYKDFMGLRDWSCVILLKTVLAFVRLCQNKSFCWRLCEVIWSCVQANLMLFEPVLCLSVCPCVLLCISVWVYVPN